MVPESITRTEHLALHATLELQELCERISAHFGLPPAEFDDENETAWGEIKVDEGVRLNVSRPFAAGTLQRWDSTVPPGCDTAVIVMLLGDRCPTEAALEALVRRYAEGLAALLGTTVFHHRTWHGPGRNTARNAAHHPPAR